MIFPSNIKVFLGALGVLVAIFVFNFF